MAADTEPLEIALHIPILCEDKNFFLSSHDGGVLFSYKCCKRDGNVFSVLKLTLEAVHVVFVPRAYSVVGKSLIESSSSSKASQLTGRVVDVAARPPRVRALRPHVLERSIKAVTP
ncbi:hypothetical protein ACJJTC_000387 [Scirpophaga incertulas]